MQLPPYTTVRPQVSEAAFITATLAAAFSSAGAVLIYLKVEKRDRGVGNCRIMIVSNIAAITAASIAMALAIATLAATGWWVYDDWIVGVTLLIAVLVASIGWCILENEASKVWCTVVGSLAARKPR